MNGPTKTVGPPWTPLPARKSKGVLEKVLDDADAVIDGIWATGPPVGIIPFSRTCPPEPCRFSAGEPAGTSCVFRYGVTSALWLIVQFGSHNCLRAPGWLPEASSLVWKKLRIWRNDTDYSQADQGKNPLPALFVRSPTPEKFLGSCPAWVNYLATTAWLFSCLKRTK